MRRKLNSGSGMTILFTLLFLLMAAMVSTVILSAALSANMRVREDQQLRQGELDLRCAAKLVEELLKQTSCTYAYEFETGQEKNERYTVAKDLEVEGPLAETLRDAIQFAVESKSTQENPSTTITPEPWGEQTLFQPVTMSYKIVPDEQSEEKNYLYRFQAKLSLPEDGGVLYLNAYSETGYAEEEEPLMEEVDGVEQPVGTRVTRHVMWDAFTLSTRED